MGPATSLSATATRTGSQTSASATVRSTLAAVTPTSIRWRATKSPASRASPTTSRTDTNYQNGLDFHFDWGASHFFAKQLQLGVAGYYFQQVTDDFGAPAALGGFRSRIAGIGPQIGYIFPMGDKLQGYLNLKGYKEFAAQNRPEGWNTWLTFAISPAAEPPAAAKPLSRKYRGGRCL